MSPTKLSTPRILQPEILPIESIGADLPPVRGELLMPAGLRARFKQTLDWTPDARDDRIKALGGDPRVASVLIALVLRETGLSVLLTQRAEHLSDHAGQISFPGGRREPEDIDAAATALREAQDDNTRFDHTKEKSTREGAFSSAASVQFIAPSQQHGLSTRAFP